MPLIVNGREIPYETVPVAYMADAVKNYLEHGLHPGSFLAALLSNDLKETFARADDENGRAVRKWVIWLWNNAPSQAWGSAQRVVEWCDQRAKAAE